MGAASCQLEGCLLRPVCRLRLLVLLELRIRLIVLEFCQARSDRLLTRQQLLQKGHDCGPAAWTAGADPTPLP